MSSLAGDVGNGTVIIRAHDDIMRGPLHRNNSCILSILDNCQEFSIFSLCNYEASSASKGDVSAASTECDTLPLKMFRVAPFLSIFKWLHVYQEVYVKW